MLQATKQWFAWKYRINSFLESSHRIDTIHLTKTNGYEWFSSKYFILFLFEASPHFTLPITKVTKLDLISLDMIDPPCDKAKSVGDTHGDPTNSFFKWVDKEDMCCMIPII